MGETPILWVKHTSHQKAKSLRAALVESWTTRSTKTLSSIKSMLNSLQNGKCSFILRTLFVQATTSTISLQKSVPLLQSTFTSLFHPHLFINSPLQSSLTLSSSIPHHFLTYFYIPLSQQSTTKIFPPSRDQGARESSED